MEPNDKFIQNEVFSKSVKAGKRTYIFDVRTTKAEDYYITITERRKRFNNEDGRFYYDKHKIFLYKEDFEKFSLALNEVIDMIHSGNIEETEDYQNTESQSEDLDYDFNSLDN